MTKNVKVSNINIKIGKKEVTLTLEEAKELRELLNETFGDKETMYVPNPYPVYPIWERPCRWYYWDVTYHTTNTDGENTWGRSTDNGTVVYSLNSAGVK